MSPIIKVLFLYPVIFSLYGCATGVVRKAAEEIQLDCRMKPNTGLVQCARAVASFIDCNNAGRGLDYCEKSIRENYSLTGHSQEAGPNSAPAVSAKSKLSFGLQASASEPDSNGIVTITIEPSAATKHLTVNGEEQSVNVNGVYTVKKLALIGKPTTYTVEATDMQGKKDIQTLTVTRNVAKADFIFEDLSPSKIRARPKRDAVAIVIGIQDYKRLPKADYASIDAQVFYDYAVRALGVPSENVKLLLDDNADNVEIYRAFQSWLPFKVKKGKTDVYVFYSGHGLPSADGKTLYFLPVGADKDLIAETAINQKRIVDALKSAQPKSVTMFIDSCYSGQIRTGETLLASARPVVLTVQDTAYPPDFTVITASASDQIASSSPDLKHGIFSYYLMKGLEGEADDKGDGTITIGKLQSYLAERVPRFAMTMSRKQEPQLTGDANRVLVAR